MSRSGIASSLEPVATDSFMTNLNTYDQCVQTSIAISLKRIADSMARRAEPEDDDTYRQRIVGACHREGARSVVETVLTASGFELDGIGELMRVRRRR